MEEVLSRSPMILVEGDRRPNRRIGLERVRVSPLNRRGVDRLGALERRAGKAAVHISA